MAQTTSALSDQLASLFAAGTCAGLTDGELLERFRASRDEAGERAFEALATRYGPMVLEICRHFVKNPTDVHDAFQAVCLVLARRAGAIRRSESLGSWLYGVTVRVAARVRAKAIRRRIRDRRLQAAASTAAPAGGSPEASVINPAERDDGAAVVHEEVARLPERYRTPIVLCYFEGLTHDEAAARLRWSVGTLRGRLAGAGPAPGAAHPRHGDRSVRDRPLAAWLIAGQSPATASAMIRAAAAASPLLVHVPASLARSAVRVAAGQLAAAGSFSAASVSLVDGVLATMILKKLTVIAGVIVTLGIGSGSGSLLVGGSQAQDAPAAAAATRTVAETAAADATTQPEIDPLLDELIQAARRRLLAQKDYYRAGRITIDRYIAASSDLARVELLAARSEVERRAIRRRHVQLATQVEAHEKAERDAGRSTVSDFTEAHQGRVQAEFDMKAGEKEDAEKTSLLRRVAELERKVGGLLKSEADRTAPRAP
jgi:RNA polymerase sigma factor (sigma-70 family)